MTDEKRDIGPEERHPGRARSAVEVGLLFAAADMRLRQARDAEKQALEALHGHVATLLSEVNLQGRTPLVETERVFDVTLRARLRVEAELALLDQLMAQAARD